jgi:peptide-methionine (S)-S-oxide reductase
MSSPSVKALQKFASKPLKPIALAAAAVLFAGTALHYTTRASAEEAHVVPAPAVDEPVGTGTETVVLAGGCFWGVQGVFQHVKGVVSATSGYTGGSKDAAHYETVSTGTTGHAESVKVVFDPKKVSFGHLLQIYFSVVHDPTELNYQGPDEGTQYRSAIFPTSTEQAKVAKAYIEQLDKAHAFHAPIVTKIEPGHTFYAAEDYHQDFLTTHPTYPYIVFNDIPKVNDLKTMFAGDYRAEPVLVVASNASAN